MRYFLLQHDRYSMCYFLCIIIKLLIIYLIMDIMISLSLSHSSRDHQVVWDWSELYVVHMTLFAKLVFLME